VQTNMAGKRTAGLLRAVGAFALCWAAGAAQADLIPMGTVDISGAGLGNVQTILTLRSPGNTSTESGSVGLNGSGQQVTSGNIQQQTKAIRIADTNITSASDLRLILNASEPQNNGASTINVNDLVLTIFSPMGQTLFTSSAFTPVNDLDTKGQPGTGNAGFVFGLSPGQAAIAQNSFAAANFLGLSSTLTNATGGLESFFVISSTQSPPFPPSGVPEPGGALLVGLAMVALAITVRRRT
jgi:hypothetical protein